MSDLKPKGNLSKQVADLLISTPSGAFGPVLRGLLLAVTTVEARTANEEGVVASWKLSSLAELIENAAVYAERNGL